MKPPGSGSLWSQLPQYPSLRPGLCVNLVTAHITMVWLWTPMEGPPVDGVCISISHLTYLSKLVLDPSSYCYTLISPILTWDPFGLTFDVHCPAKQYQIRSILLSALDLLAREVLSPLARPCHNCPALLRCQMLKPVCIFCPIYIAGSFLPSEKCLNVYFECNVVI